MRFPFHCRALSFDLDDEISLAFRHSLLCALVFCDALTQTEYVVSKLRCHGDDLIHRLLTISDCVHCEEEPCVYNQFYYYLKWYGSNFDFKRVDVSNKARRRISYDMMCKILEVDDIEDLPPCLLEGVRRMYPNPIGVPYSSNL